MTIYRNAPFYLSGMVLAILVGFWQSYFTVLASVKTSFHVHGSLMFLWVLLLIGQTWLNRTRRYQWHRLVGKTSFVVAPLIVWSGLIVAHESVLRGNDGLTAGELQTLTLPLISLFMFVVLYVNAIYFRREPELHARFMISTGLAVIGAAVFRVFFNWVPGFGTLSAAAHAYYITLELIVVALILNDWRLGGLRAPFVVLLVLLGFNHVMFATAADMAWWQALGEAFYRWPNLAPWGPPV